MNTPERWIDVDWTPNLPDKERQIARIHIVVLHQPGTIATITSIIAKENSNITNMQISNRTQEFYEFIIDIEVKNTEHLSQIMANLRLSSRVLSVTRI